MTPYGPRSGSTLAQVMACCLKAPSHYLNQCWLIINSQEITQLGNSAINHWNYLENKVPKISFKFPRGQWVKIPSKYTEAPTATSPGWESVFYRHRVFKRRLLKLKLVTLGLNAASNVDTITCCENVERCWLYAHCPWKYYADLGLYRNRITDAIKLHVIFMLLHLDYKLGLQCPAG